MALSPREAERLRLIRDKLRELDAMDSRASKYVPHKPTPKQAEFLAVTSLEALYGGAAGGGKTDAALMAALEYVNTPGYSALILRRTFADLSLPGAVMDRAREWLSDTDAVWHDRDKTWTFPSGASLTFGYCDTERDRFRYQGAEIQFLGVDELTQWPEQWYRYLLSRLRRPKGMAVPIRARSTSNPGGIGHHWVRRRFVDAATAEGVFVPARLDDNPHLDRDEYRKSLARLDSVTRRQLEQGDWVADGSGLVYSYDPGRNRIDAAPDCDHYGLALDYGVTNATSFSVLGWRNHDRTVYVVRSWKQTGLSPSDAADVTRTLEKQWRPEFIVGDVGGLGKGFAVEAQRRYQVPIEAADKNNKRGYIALLNGALERAEVKIVAGACDELAKEWLELPWAEDRTKEAAGFENHCADGVLYGWRRCFAFLEEPAAPKPSEQERMMAQVVAQQRAKRAWWEAEPDLGDDRDPFGD